MSSFESPPQALEPTRFECKVEKDQSHPNFLPKECRDFTYITSNFYSQRARKGLAPLRGETPLCMCGRNTLRPKVDCENILREIELGTRRATRSSRRFLSSNSQAMPFSTSTSQDDCIPCSQEDTQDCLQENIGFSAGTTLSCSRSRRVTNLKHSVVRDKGCVSISSIETMNSENAVLEFCGSDCINRQLHIECDPKTCPHGNDCSNQMFRRAEHADVEVFETSSKGFGVRARSKILAGSFIVEYVGEVIHMDEYMSRIEKKKKNDFYGMALEGDFLIDATGKANFARFINHSCEPNCETQKWTTQGEGHGFGGKTVVGIFAIRDIEVGEELSYDYQFEFFGTPQNCYCGSNKCRGYIGKPGIYATEGSTNSPRLLEEADKTPRPRRKYNEQKLITSSFPVVAPPTVAFRKKNSNKQEKSSQQVDVEGNDSGKKKSFSSKKDALTVLMEGVKNDMNPKKSAIRKGKKSRASASSPQSQKKVSLGVKGSKKQSPSRSRQTISSAIRTASSLRQKKISDRSD